MNQDCAVKGQIIDSINIILNPSNFTVTRDLKIHFQLQLKCIELLQVLLEEIHVTKSEELVRVIAQQLDIHILVKTLQDVGCWSQSSNDGSSFEHEVALFRGYNVFKTVIGYYGESDDLKYFSTHTYIYIIYNYNTVVIHYSR